MKRLLLVGLATLAVGAGDAWACRCALAGVTNPELVREAFDNATFVAEVEIVSTATVTETRRVRSTRSSRRSKNRRHEGNAMNTKPTSFNTPVPELPVADVERAQAHYRDTFGFQVGWIQPGKDIGAVNRDNTAIFFRKRTAPFEPAVHWVHAPEIDTTFEEMKAAGARIVEPLETKPWGLRQFTVEDLDRNRFYFHCD